MALANAALRTALIERQHVGGTTIHPTLHPYGLTTAVSFLLATRMDGHGHGEERCDPLADWDSIVRGFAA